MNCVVVYLQLLYNNVPREVQYHTVSLALFLEEV